MNSPIIGYCDALKNYKGIMYDGHSGNYYIIGCRTAGNFTTVAELKRYIDENLWPCPRNAGG